MCCPLHLLLDSVVSEDCEGKRNAISARVLSVALKTGLPVYFSRLEEARIRYDEGNQT